MLQRNGENSPKINTSHENSTHEATKIRLSIYLYANEKVRCSESELLTDRLSVNDVPSQRYDQMHRPSQIASRYTSIANPLHVLVSCGKFVWLAICVNP